MSSELNAELEQTLNNYLSNRSPENIVASSNSTRKIVEMVRGRVSVPGAPTVQDLETIPLASFVPEEPEWMQTLRNQAKRCDSRPVENSPRMVNQLTKVSEILPSVVDQLTTLANQEKLDNQSASG